MNDTSIAKCHWCLSSWKEICHLMLMSDHLCCMKETFEKRVQDILEEGFAPPIVDGERTSIWTGEEMTVPLANLLSCTEDLYKAISKQAVTRRQVGHHVMVAHDVKTWDGDAFVAWGDIIATAEKERKVKEEGPPNIKLAHRDAKRRRTTTDPEWCGMCLAYHAHDSDEDEDEDEEPRPLVRTLSSSN